MMLRFHTQTGGVTLTAQQPENNIVRVALQAFAAVCGGTQSLHTNGYDEALALPTERAAKIALRTQQIVAHESGATDTVDPFAGSYFVESLTAEIERRARKLIEQVDELGGSVEAIAFIKNEIEESAFGYHERYRTEQDVVVGVNQLRRGRRRGRGDPDASTRPTERAQVERLKAFKADRDQELADRRLEELREAAPRRPATCCRRSARRSRTAARSARSAARCATSSASTSRTSDAGVVSTPGGERWAELRELPVPRAGRRRAARRGPRRGHQPWRADARADPRGLPARPGDRGRRRGRPAQGRAGGRPRRLARLGGVRHRARAPLGPAPDAIDFATAAALPMAGTTALEPDPPGGDLLGRNVTVTGASGGVGVIAVQLARLAGANVEAVSAVTDDVPDGQDVILESAGGASLDQALAKVALGGLVLVFGNSSKEPSHARLPELRGPRSRSRPVVLLGALRAPRRRQPAHAAGLVAAARCRSRSDSRRRSREVNDALDALDQRRVPGKAILRAR